MAWRGAVDPHLGFDPVLKAFVACVVGGFGDAGAVLGGFLLGAVEVAMLVMLPQSLGGRCICVWNNCTSISLATRRNIITAYRKGDKH